MKRRILSVSDLIAFRHSLLDNAFMTWVTVEEIKRDLADYLQRVGRGETLVVTQSGKPVAEIKPVTNGAIALRPFGLCAGEFTVPDDFDEPLPGSILNDFEGG
jgi:prevent-host-death family protein